MIRAIRIGSWALLVTAIVAGASPGLAEDAEQVKPVFKHVIPNIDG